jgi:hypothetical protein
MRLAVRGQDTASAACAGDAKELTFVAPFAARGDDGSTASISSSMTSATARRMVMRYVPADIGPVAGIEEQVVLVDGRQFVALRLLGWTHVAVGVARARSPAVAMCESARS